MNTQESKNCSCCKIAKIVVAGLILLCSATSAFYSYKTSKTLDAIIAPQAAQSKSITEAYAKGKSLEEAKATGKPVVAVFYADWCGYCKKFAPTFAKIIKKSSSDETSRTGASLGPETRYCVLWLGQSKNT